MDNAKKCICIEKALDSLNIRKESRNCTERKNKREPLKSRFRGIIHKMELTSLREFEILRFVKFVHLPFSVGSLDLFVALLVFTEGTSCCVIRRNLK